jgi:CPA1 family monovalent cation:H+ antiporter
MEDGDGRRVPSTPLTVEDAAAQDGDAAAVRAATEAQRKRLFALRADGTIGDAAFQRVEEELDWAELDWEQLIQAGQRSSGEG